MVIGDNSKYEKPDDLKLPLEVIPLSDLLPIISHFPKPCINNLSPISDGSLGTSLVAQWLRPCLPTQGLWVQCLVWELRSDTHHGQKNTETENRQYYTNSIKMQFGSLSFKTIVKSIVKEVLFQLCWSKPCVLICLAVLQKKLLI